MSLKHALLSTLADTWWWFAQSAGVLAIAGTISLLVLWSFSTPGVVMVITRAPRLLTPEVAYKGELLYRISTMRKASCPGLVVILMTSIDNDQPITVTFTRPVHSVEIKPTDDALVVVTLPASVTPGKWRYRAFLDSQCPTFNAHDVLADFFFAVTGRVARHEKIGADRPGPVLGKL